MARHPELKKRTIEGIWCAYRDEVLFANGARPSDVQLIETRRAIYAACYALLVMLRDDVSEESEEAGAGIMQGLLDETVMFHKAVGTIHESAGLKP